MSIEAAPKPGPPVRPGPALPDRERFSIEALQELKRARAGVGLLLIVAAVAIMYAIVLAFTGHFTNVVKIDAMLPLGSNAVPIGAPVEYRDVTVGKVGSEGQAPDGAVAVKFDLYPAKMAQVPKGVEAQVAPLSIFGNQFVNLVAPKTIGPVHLAAGDFISPFSGAPSTSLQGTVTQLYSLLHAIHPADLDTALTAFATALDGEGSSLGQTLAGASDYLGTAVVPHLSNLQGDLKLTDPVSNAINAATPDVLGILANSTVTAHTLTSQEASLRTLLGAGDASVGTLANTLEQVDNALPSLLNQSGPLLGDITQSPNELSQVLQGLTQFASAVADAEEQGPYLSVTANLPVVNISAGVNAALGYDNPTSVDEALGSAVNPATYTAANCPEYAGETNPYCGVGGSPDANPVSAAALPGTSTGDGARSRSAGASSGAVAGVAGAADASPYLQELEAVEEIAAALNGGRAPAAPGAAELVLYPLLSSMAARS